MQAVAQAGNSDLRIQAVFVLIQGLKSDKERVWRKAAENFLKVLFWAFC